MLAVNELRASCIGVDAQLRLMASTRAVLNIERLVEVVVDSEGFAITTS